MSQLDVDRPGSSNPAPPGRGDARVWTAADRAGQYMLVVAAIFVFPIVGFIAMAFRSGGGQHR